MTVIGLHLRHCVRVRVPTLSVTVTLCPLEDMRTNAMIKLPAVLLVGNDTDTEPTPDPSIAFDCTSPIPPPLPPLVLIVRFNALLAVNELVSVTRTVKLLVPVPVGVPEIAPVLDPSASPAGKAPEPMDQVYGVAPPVDASVAL